MRYLVEREEASESDHIHKGQELKYSKVRSHTGQTNERVAKTNRCSKQSFWCRFGRMLKRFLCYRQSPSLLNESTLRFIA